VRIFKEEDESKRVTFNIRLDLALRLEKAKEDVRLFDKRLAIDGIVNAALEKFLKKAEKKIVELKSAKGKGEKHASPRTLGGAAEPGGAGNRADQGQR